MKIKKLLVGIFGASLFGVTLVIAADYTISTITNTATITDEETGHSASASVSIIHKQPNNTLVVQKWVDNPLPDLGEEITYTIRVKNDADTLTAKKVILVDDFDETKAAIIGIVSECTIDETGAQTCAPPNPSQCVVDASKLTCDFGDLEAQHEKIIKYSVYTIAIGTFVNTAVATSAYGESTGDCTVLVRDRETPWLMTKNPDKGTIERGETVSYTVSITNQAPDKTYYDLRLVDNYPENTIELTSIASGTDVSCQDDGAEIRCQIPSLAPGETKSFTATFRAIMDGVAQNTVTINDHEGYTDGVSSTIVVTEPIAKDIVLSSNCDGRTVLVGQKCTLRLLATYDFLPPEDISNNDNVTYYGYEEIGTLQGNILTVTTADYAQIHARYFTGHQEIESNSITLNVDNAIGIGTNLDGKHIDHIPLRLHQGASETGVFDQVLESGAVTADPRAGAKYDRLVINGYGGSGHYFWSVGNGTPATVKISNFSTGTACTAQTAQFCQNTDGTLSGKQCTTANVATDCVGIGATPACSTAVSIGYSCTETGTVILESLSATETTTTLQIRDDAGNSEEIMVHLLPAVTKKIEITDAAGSLIDATQYRSLEKPISFFSQETLWGGLINTESTGENIIWEFSTGSIAEAGEVWTNATATASLGGGVFQSSEPGIFRIRAKKVQNVALPGSTHLTQQEETVISEPIVVVVSDGVNIGFDSNGDKIAHIPLRLHQGASETGVLEHLIEDMGADGLPLADPRAGAKYDRLVINGYGGDGTYTWNLEDATAAKLYSFSDGTECPADATTGELECANMSTIVLESTSATETTTALRISDNAGNSEEIMVHLLPAVTKKIEIADASGNVITETLEIPMEENLPFFSATTLWGGLKSPNTGEGLVWEFSFQGGEWTVSDENAVLGGGFLQPKTTGIFQIRAKKTQKIALPGAQYLMEREEIIVSEPVTVLVSAPVPKIESIRTAGNLGIAEGARETLFVRMSHFGTFSEVHDIEINLVKGEYKTLEDIPADVQYFKIEALRDEVIQNISADKTTLLQIPFFIPLLGDLHGGKHTLLFTIRNKNGETGNDAPTALLSLFIGDPIKGDGNLDGEIDLRDAVIMKRVLKKTIAPDSLVFLALDIDENDKIEISDFVNAFREFLQRFLNS